MKTNKRWKYVGGALTLLFCAAMEIHAQQRTGGGGGGGFGGFGGFGGGGFNNANRNSASSASSSQYNNNGSVGNAVIYVDPDTKNIMVIADQPTGEQISNVIANLDAPKPQVLIKVVFMEVQHNNQTDIGVEGNYTGLNKNFSAITGYLTNYTIANVISGVGSNAISTPTVVPSSITPVQQSLSLNNNFGLASAGNPAGLYQVLGSDFTATLRAIAQAGKAQVLSRPSILARNGQLAKIVVGQEVYLPSGVSYTTAGNTTIPVINGNYTDVGIILNVTPFIGENGLVEMILQPQISSVDTSTPGQLIAAGSSLLGAASTPVYAPNLNIRSADTVVVTSDAQTVVIGGLIANTKSSTTSKIPFLGDIPLLGNFFKSTSKTDDKTELLIFLTPHIIQLPSQLAALSIEEKSRTLTPKSYSEEELDRFLDKLPVKKPAKNNSSSN